METSTTSPGVMRPACHRWVAQIMVAAAITTRATSLVARILSLYIQLRPWARPSSPKAAWRRARSRSRAEKAFTAKMLLRTSISSPPDSLERWANSRWRSRPRRPKATRPAVTVATKAASARVITLSSEANSSRAPMKFTQGGAMSQTMRLTIMAKAPAVEVTRCPSAPAIRSWKKRMEWPARCWNRSSLISTPALMVTREPSQPLVRHRTLSTATRAMNSMSAPCTTLRWPGGAVMASISSFMPYCTPTAQEAPASTTTSRAANWSGWAFR